MERKWKHLVHGWIKYGIYDATDKIHGWIKYGIYDATDKIQQRYSQTSYQGEVVQ